MSKNIPQSGSQSFTDTSEDEQGELAAKYGVRCALSFSHASWLSQFMIQVRALPTVIAFKDGEPVAKFVGAIPESEVSEFLKSV